MMQLWKIVLISLFLPLAVIYRLTTFLAGKKRAQSLFFDIIVAVSAKVLAWNIPSLEQKQPFPVFSENFITAMAKMPFEKIQVTINTADTFQINVTRCQFTEVFDLLGMPELTPALCEGDVAFCEKYQPLVRFQRLHNIAAGDRFCDHTYFHQHTPD